MSTTIDEIAEYLNENLIAKEATFDRDFMISISKAVLIIKECFGNDKKMLIAGNGGSAGDSQHLAAELVGRFVKERDGLSAISLTTDSSILTAWSNDYEFETIFARQLQAIEKKGIYSLVFQRVEILKI